MDILDTVKYWAEHSCFDEETRMLASRLLLEEHKAERIECFNGLIEFGTGGLRGPMGIGTKRMNRYTVMRATEGLAKVIEKSFVKNITQIKADSFSGVVIGYDSRNNSRFFAEVCTEVLTGHGISVYLFSEIAPTPLVSCEIIRRKACAGIIITASHNPPWDNGYKVYWSHGGQIISPIENLIIEEIKAVTRFESIPSLDLQEARLKGLLKDVNEEADQYYFSELENFSWGDQKANQDYSVLYSPLHGTGSRLVPKLFNKKGFKKFRCIEEQMILDGNFPTLISPNPEDHMAYEMAIDQADDNDDLIITNDPDADRLGVMVRNEKLEWQRLNGNQIGVLLLDYVLSKRQATRNLPNDALLILTVVSSPMAVKIASSYGLKVVETLTGFKWIWNVAVECRKSEEGSFVFGMEESHGYLCGHYTGDKDGVWAALVFAELGATLKSKGTFVSQQLENLYQQHGDHLDYLYTLPLKGEEGSRIIEKIMKGFRRNPPKSLGGLKLLKKIDFLYDEQIEIATGKISKGPGLPESNIIILELEGGSRVIARPSGTEPKIKFYFNLYGRKMDELKNLLVDVQDELDDYRKLLLRNGEN